MASKVADGDRPAVFAGTMFEGNWVVPGGASYMAGLLQDAGGRYVFAGDQTHESLQVDQETMLDKAGDAEVWVNAGIAWKTLADATAEDPRYGEFAAYRGGDVWNYGRIQTPSGGVDFFESAVMRPQDLLADLVTILHPDLAGGHQLVWYQKVAAA